MKYPYEKAVATLAEGVVEGAGNFLGAICLPFAEEFGFLLKDKVSNWRANNAVNIVTEAQKLIGNSDLTELAAPPRIVMEVINKGSWNEEDYIQSFWAGLLASSVTEGGRDDGNLLFVDLLGQLTSVQIKILNFACEQSEKFHTKVGWIYASGLMVTLEALVKITDIQDYQRLDRELDSLRAAGLIGGELGLGGGFDIEGLEAWITPTPLALQMYVRGQGYVGSPIDYFNTEEVEPGKKPDIQMELVNNIVMQVKDIE